MYAWLDYVIITGQFLFSTVAIFMLFKLWPVHTHRTNWYKRIWGWRPQEPSTNLLIMLGLSREELTNSERAILLASCGFELSVLTYCAWRRLLQWISVIILLILSAGLYSRLWMFDMVTGGIFVAVFAVLLGLHLDIYWLKLYRELRAVAITREIFAISNQLLYFEDSNLHIHTKLRRCLPYSRLLRKDMETLLAEWYHDPALALQTFKRKIGTAEGISFVESISALWQQQDKSFYELLRAHLRDYKERLELAKESRKESTSYLLFIIAGIPILYTFQLFLYPWVQEVNKLMSQLN